MTVCENLQNKIDTCTKNAILYYKLGDGEMLSFWISARKGFIEKRNNLTLEKASKEMDAIRI